MVARIERYARSKFGFRKSLKNEKREREEREGGRGRERENYSHVGITLNKEQQRKIRDGRGYMGKDGT